MTIPILIMLTTSVGACDEADAVCLRNRVLELRGEKANVEKALDLERSARKAAQEQVRLEQERAASWQDTAHKASQRTWVERNPGLIYGGGVATGVVATALIIFLTSR